MITRVLLPHRENIIDLTPRARPNHVSASNVRRAVEPLLKAMIGWAPHAAGRHMEIDESLAGKIPTSILEAKKSAASRARKRA